MDVEGGLGHGTVTSMFESDFVLLPFLSPISCLWPEHLHVWPRERQGRGRMRGVVGLLYVITELEGDSMLHGLCHKLFLFDLKGRLFCRVFVSSWFSTVSNLPPKCLTPVPVGFSLGQAFDICLNKHLFFASKCFRGTFSRSVGFVP